MEAEERGDGWFQGMAKRDCHLPSGGDATPAGGQHQALALECFAFAECQFETTRDPPSYPLGRTVRQEFDSRRFGRVEQTVHDGLGGICHWEYAAIVLGLELYASSFKPGDRVTWLKDLEGREQRPSAAGIVAAQISRLEAGVSDIATSAAGNANLREELGAFLEQRNSGSRSRFRARDRSEEPGRATAHDRHTPFVHSGQPYRRMGLQGDAGCELRQA